MTTQKQRMVAEFAALAINWYFLIMPMWKLIIGYRTGLKLDSTKILLIWISEIGKSLVIPRSNCKITEDYYELESHYGIIKCSMHSEYIPINTTLDIRVLTQKNTYILNFDDCTSFINDAN